MRKPRFKINNDTMTSIVIYSLLFCVAIALWSMVLASFGIDCSAVTGNVLEVFGKELAICGILTLYQRWASERDRRREKKEQERNDI